VNQGWIIVPNWRRFQHYGDRRPAWIKNYTALLHDDDYLALTLAQRGLLHGIWLMYAASDGRLSARTLSREFPKKVRKDSLEALNHAGFITIVDSKPLEQRRVLKNSSKEAASKRARSSGSLRGKKKSLPPPLPNVCPECGVGAGYHADDCSKATQ
jgi:hypothetical protein